MAKPSVKPTAPKIPQKHGGALQAGAGGGPQPGSGRPPDAFKDFLRKEIREAVASRDALVRASQDETGRNFGSAWKLAADYDDEKPAEKHQVVGPIEVRVRFVAEGKKTTAS